jgi:prefoldin subunit 5
MSENLNDLAGKIKRLSENVENLYVNVANLDARLEETNNLLEKLLRIYSSHLENTEEDLEL